MVKHNIEFWREKQISYSIEKVNKSFSKNEHEKNLINSLNIDRHFRFKLIHIFFIFFYCKSIYRMRNNNNACSINLLSTWKTAIRKVKTKNSKIICSIKILLAHSQTLNITEFWKRKYHNNNCSMFIFLVSNVIIDVRVNMRQQEKIRATGNAIEPKSNAKATVRNYLFKRWVNCNTNNNCPLEQFMHSNWIRVDFFPFIPIVCFLFSLLCDSVFCRYRDLLWVKDPPAADTHI